MRVVLSGVDSSLLVALGWLHKLFRTLSKLPGQIREGRNGMAGGLGGLNKSPDGMVIGLVQWQLPVCETREQVTQQAERVVDTVRARKRGMPQLDLIVFPEYTLHGLSMSTRRDLMCTLEDPEIRILHDVCREMDVWGCFSLMEHNPNGNPFNSGIIVNNEGERVLYYRKLHPWCALEAWEPGDLGIPVCDGPAGSKIALIICHDGMFPEMWREAAYKGANLILRTAGYTAPIRQNWRTSAQFMAFATQSYTASVALCGSDGVCRSMGEAVVCDYEGEILAHGQTSHADEMITCEVVPRRTDEAREGWLVENNQWMLGHRGFVAKKGGATDCPYTYMQDLVAGKYRVPWEDRVKITDGLGAGFPPPRADAVRVDT